MKYKYILFTGAILGAIAVIFGAFGAHALADQISVKQLSSYKTGNTYHFFHVFLLMLIGILYHLKPTKLLKIAFWMCLAGIILFSGSLYLIACRDLLGINSTSILGPMTPIGGVFFIGAWITLGINFISKKDE
ncbi:DUF423 domain-containing protein [Portibacter marinus]|uniref:DUF423 domain-containing protein n=1 Tax=Portibacter marinus TaxID=2898660 RepID=UPI001F209A1C|nr:DUF423 domain-containing protein [Portibacter marinus]